MKTWKQFWILPLLLLFLAGCQSIPPATGYGSWITDPQFLADLQKQESGSNGIEVGEPKIYDDSSLRLMLDQARNRLALINSLNETALISRLGSVTGARIGQTQFGVQVTGGGSPLAGVTTTTTGPTSSTTMNTFAPGTPPTGPTASTVTTDQSVVTTANPVTPPATPSTPSGLGFTPPSGMSVSALDLLNEEMQLTYEIANLQLLLEGALSDRFVKNQRIIKPRATIGFPISLRPQPRYKNAVAIVEVEVETAKKGRLSDEPPAITALLPREKTYNVAAITDKMTSIGGGAAIGMFGVSGSYLWGRKTYYLVQDQDTVAIQRPSVPEKPNTTSFAWEFRPVLGAKFLRGGLKQTFVQLAFPKLESSSGDCFGAMRVRTYWRHFDQKTGIAKQPIEGSILSREKRLAIPRYDLTPFVENVDYQDLGDGTVLVFVKGRFLTGTYVQLGPTRYEASKGLLVEDSGLTFVAPAAALARWTGKAVSRDGKKSDLLNVSVQKHLPALDQFSCVDDTPNPPKVQIRDVHISSDKRRIEIEMQKTAPGSPGPAGVALVDNQNQSRVDLASSVVTGLSGDSPVISAQMATADVPSLIGSDPQSQCPDGSIVIKDVTVKPLNENDSELRVSFDQKELYKTDNVLQKEKVLGKVLLEIGYKVFGLADTAVKRDPTANPPSITAVVPTSLLVAGRRVRAFRMFWTAPDGDSSAEDGRRCFDNVWPLKEFDLSSTVERLVLVSVDSSGKATYLLYGNGLTDAKVIAPNVKILPFDGVPPDRMRKLEIEKDDLKNAKMLFLKKAGSEYPLALNLPQPDFKTQEPKVTLDTPVIQNTDEMDVSLENAKDLSSVKMGDKVLHYLPPEKGKNSIHLINLKADGVTTEQKTRELTFEFKDKTKVTVKLEVVSARIGVK